MFFYNSVTIFEVNIETSIIGSDFLFYIRVHCPQLFFWPAAVPASLLTLTILSCNLNFIHGVKTSTNIKHQQPQLHLN